MTSLSERIAVYALLPAEERAAVNREAADHPHLAADLAEAHALADLLDTAASDPSADLADAVADEATGGTTGTAYIAAALNADPSIEPDLARLRERAADLLAESSAQAQFEHLVGSARLADVPVPRPASPHRPARPAPDRAAAQGRRAASPLRRRVLVALAAVLVAFGGLRVASEAGVTDRERLADLGDLASYEPLVTRSTDADPLETRLDAALDAVADARRSTLGLFPRYDSVALDAAAAEISAIVAGAPAQSAVSQEARLALARVRLHEGRDAEAARLLAALVRDASYRAPEARRLLDFLRTQAPEPPSEAT